MAQRVIVLDENQKKKGFFGTFLNWLIYFLILAVAYWVILPPIHLQSKDFWNFVLFALILRLVMSGFSAIKKAFFSEKDISFDKTVIKNTFRSFGSFSKIVAAVIVLIVAFMLIGGVVGAEIFNANRYATLLSTEDGDFSTDVAELPMNSIPVVDRDTAQRLGLRKLGEMSDLVSQFEVDEYYYTQINYQGNPCRVTPLMYGDTFKWLGNQKEGIPAYILVNMVTQDTTLVRLEQGIKFSDSEYFLRDLNRHLRFSYPTKIFDNISFELDEQGTPYWVASTVDFRIGIFSGRDIDGAVLCNAITGECEFYPLNEVPTWVDQVYSSDLLFEQLTYNGKYQSGYINSIFGQKGVLQPTDGYNYIAINDDVYLYTGITSVAGDESNLGFVLVNLRTKETTYYACPGAEEYSAMDSAEGQVQHLSYEATFPILLNVGNRPTYFMSLKDSAGLVKMYAFVDVQQYQIVGTGSSVDSAREDYLKKLAADGQLNPPSDELVEQSAVVLSVATAVVDGNSMYYIMLDDGRVISASITLSPDLPFLAPGDTVTVTLSGTQATTLKVTKANFYPEGQ
jgi:archaellum component FlaF (FlaF/FlaG flagellin family)